MLQFSEWLRLHQGLLFNDLTSEQARSHFVEFVEAWNRRALPARLYKGIAGTTLRRTKHAWSIKGAPPLHAGYRIIKCDICQDQVGDLTVDGNLSEMVWPGIGYYTSRAILPWSDTRCWSPWLT